MTFKDSKILIISLTKSGSLDYALEICKHARGLKPFYLFSSQVRQEVVEGSHFLSTYADNLLSFIWNSLLFAFSAHLLLFRFRKLGVRKLYFTVFHPWNLLIIAYSKLWGMKSIVTVHDYQTHLGERSFLIEGIQKLSMLLADKIIFLSQAERQKAISDRRFWASKSEVLLHPLMDTGIVNSLEHQAELKFLFLGRLRDYKGVRMLYDVARENNFHLTIAGSGDPGKMQTTDRITIINRHLDKQEMAKLLAEHHVLVLPYLEASQSGILSLGLYAEMVMIVSDVGGLSEQLDCSSAIWIKTDYDNLNQAMTSLTNSAESYEGVKKSCREFKPLFQRNWEIDFNTLMRRHFMN